MKKYSALILLILIFSITTVYSQNTCCNSFDSNLMHVKIDTNGLWEIGKPTKQNFNNSYSGDFSIVTHLDSLYPLNNTSTFEISSCFDGEIPNYLGLYMPLVIEFNHRFITDSEFDFGKIEMSFDDGIKWYDVLSDEHNADWQYGGGIPQNFHYFESTGDTIFDSLEVHGNSDGWVHSIISKDIGALIGLGTNPDTIIIKFTFISDNVGRSEGWQIDDFCLTVERPNFVSVNKVSSPPKLSIYPNPNNGSFIVDNVNINNGVLEIFDLKGILVYSIQMDSKEHQNIITGLKPGIYIVQIGNEKSRQISKLIIK